MFDRHWLSRRIIGESFHPADDREEMPPVVTPEKTPEQMKMLMDRVSKSWLLREIDEKRLIAALKRLKPKEIKSGQTLFKQGEMAYISYIVEEGKLKAYERDEDNNDLNDKGDELGTYSPHTPCIDEMALLGKVKRYCTVIAETDAKLWEIERIIYFKVIAKMAYEREKRRINFLTNVRLLDRLDLDFLDLLVSMCSKKFAKGDVIMKQGDKPDRVYFVEEGEVELTTKSGEKKTLLRADCFGELALLTTKLRQETCIAKTDCWITFFDVKDFEQVVGGPLQEHLKKRPGHYKKICKEYLGTGILNSLFDQNFWGIRKLWDSLIRRKLVVSSSE